MPVKGSSASSVEEPEATSLRTENASSISDRNFSGISDRVEKSVCRSLMEIETNHRELLKMIENISSKIDSLSERNPDSMDLGVNGFQPEIVAWISRNCETDGMTQDEGPYKDDSGGMSDSLDDSMTSWWGMNSRTWHYAASHW